MEVCNGAVGVLRWLGCMHGFDQMNAWICRERHAKPPDSRQDMCILNDVVAAQCVT